MDWLKRSRGDTLAPEPPHTQNPVTAGAPEDPDEDVWLPDEDSLMNELQPGELFAGRYRLLRPLGRGAVGWVLKARDIELDLDVAIKVLRGGLEPELRDTLRSEARVALRLDHPRICRAYHFGRAEGRPYLVLELLRGEDLHRRRRRLPGRRLPIEEVVSAGLDSIAALEHAHGHGVVHNDMKPGNLFRTAHGPIKVCDFGLAGLRAGPLVIGTPAYLDPARISSGRSGAWSDIYGLGATLYTLAHGEPPFGRGEDAFRRALAEERPISPHIPAALHDVIVSCLSLDTAARPRLAELREGLLGAAADLRLVLDDDALEITPHTGPIGNISAELAKLRLAEPDPVARTPQPPQQRAAPRKRAPGERHVPSADFAVVPSCTITVHDDARAVAACRIGRHPVTNGLYERFIKDTGHRAPDGWTRRGYPAGREDHPVAGVTFEDATAFAGWAGARLPTTHEWLAALRGREGRRFPWGDECDAARCACPAVTTDRQTRGVHTAPESATPEGVQEMLGNVWEWTTDGPPLPDGAGADQRWVAGGSYSHACGQEKGREPITAVSTVHAYSYLGFRIARDLGGDR